MSVLTLKQKIAAKKFKFFRKTTANDAALTGRLRYLEQTLVEQRQRLDEMAVPPVSLQEQNAELKQELLWLQSSFSYRLGAPIRYFARKVIALRKRLGPLVDIENEPQLATKLAKQLKIHTEGKKGKEACQNSEILLREANSALTLLIVGQSEDWLNRNPGSYRVFLDQGISEYFSGFCFSIDMNEMSADYKGAIDFHKTNADSAKVYCASINDGSIKQGVINKLNARIEFFECLSSHFDDVRYLKVNGRCVVVFDGEYELIDELCTWMLENGYGEIYRVSLVGEETSSNALESKVLNLDKAPLSEVRKYINNKAQDVHNFSFVRNLSEDIGSRTQLLLRSLTQQDSFVVLVCQKIDAISQNFIREANNVGINIKVFEIGVKDSDSARLCVARVDRLLSLGASSFVFTGNLSAWAISLFSDAGVELLEVPETAAEFKFNLIQQTSKIHRKVTAVIKAGNVLDERRIKQVLDQQYWVSELVIIGDDSVSTQLAGLLADNQIPVRFYPLPDAAVVLDHLDDFMTDSSEFLWLVDPDVEYAPSWLSQIMKGMLLTNSAVGTSALEYVSPGQPAGWVPKDVKLINSALELSNATGNTSPCLEKTGLFTADVIDIAQFQQLRLDQQEYKVPSFEHFPGTSKLCLLGHLAGIYVHIKPSRKLVKVDCDDQNSEIATHKLALLIHLSNIGSEFVSNLNVQNLSRASGVPISAISHVLEG